MRYIPLLFCLAGGGILVYSIGSYCGHSMPYQDPTPELLSVQQYQLHTAKILAVVGVLLIIIGGVWGFFPKRASTASH